MHGKLRAVLIAATLFFFFGPVIAQHPQKIPVTVFYGRECPYCHQALTLLSNLSERYPIKMVKYEVYHSRANLEKFEEKAAAFGLDKGELRVPFIVIGNRYILGYDREKIEQYVEDYFKGSEDANADSNAFLL